MEIQMAKKVTKKAAPKKVREENELTLELKKTGCPFCNYKGPLTAEHFEWFMVNKNKVMTLEFAVKRYDEVRKHLLRKQQKK